MDHFHVFIGENVSGHGPHMTYAAAEEDAQAWEIWVKDVQETYVVRVEQCTDPLCIEHTDYAP